PRLKGRSMGVFAPRSPHRPNPIGLTLAQIEKVEKNVITLSEINLIEGTPVLDIRPYMPTVEALPQATEGWSAQAEDKVWPVILTDEMLSRLQKKYTDPRGLAHLQQLIVETLRRDPRPLVYKEAAQTTAPTPYRSEHVFRLFN